MQHIIISLATILLFLAMPLSPMEKRPGSPELVGEIPSAKWTAQDCLEEAPPFTDEEWIEMQRRFATGLDTDREDTSDTFEFKKHLLQAGYAFDDVERLWHHIHDLGQAQLQRRRLLKRYNLQKDFVQIACTHLQHLDQRYPIESEQSEHHVIDVTQEILSPYGEHLYYDKFDPDEINLEQSLKRFLEHLHQEAHKQQKQLAITFNIALPTVPYLSMRDLLEGNRHAHKHAQQAIQSGLACANTRPSPPENPHNLQKIINKVEKRAKGKKATLGDIIHYHEDQQRKLTHKEPNTCTLQ